MKVKDIKNCKLCHKPLLHTQLPMCWEVTVNRLGFDMGAIQRESGMRMFLGSNDLAEAMGLDEDIAKPIGDPVRSYVCETCAMEPNVLAMLGEDQ